MSKLFSTLNAIIENDSNSIKSIEVIMSTELDIVVQEGHLGITLAAIKVLLVYLFQQLQYMKTNNMSVVSFANTYQTITRGIILLKGDYPLAYNTRKLLLQQQLLDYNYELKLLALVFSKHPKSPSGWQHRRWCLLTRTTTERSNNTNAKVTEISNSDNSGNYGVVSMSELETKSDFPLILIESEKELTRVIAESSPKNYYAWMHRLWLLQFMSSHQVCNRYCLCPCLHDD